MKVLLRSFSLLLITILALPAYGFSCKEDSSSKPIFSNQNICIQQYKKGSSLSGHIEVNIISPSTIDERNRWLNEAGEWLKKKGLDPCSDMTSYMTDVESVKPPLRHDVEGIPGEKAFYRTGGLDKPKFCPNVCQTLQGYHLDRKGRCK